MSGKGTNAGSLYQARVIACLYVDILGRRPITWYGPVRRVPTAVWAETHGPGDDIRIEFETGAAGEAQARHDMNAAGDLVQLVADIRGRSSATGSLPVALVVPQTASRALFANVQKDLDLLRGGRDDGLHAEVTALRTDANNRPILDWLFVVQVDVDDANSPNRLLAVDHLSRLLVEAGRGDEAFDVLVTDALQLEAEAGRRDRDYLIGLLEDARDLKLRPPERDERWLRELDWISDFLFEQHYDQAALERLDAIDKDLQAVEVSPRVRARLHRLRVVALLRLERTREALSAAEQCLSFDPDWSEGLEVAARAALIAGELAVAQARAARAVDADQANPKAWAATALIAAAAGGTPPTPPSNIANHRDYIGALVDVAHRNEDFEAILELTGRLVADPPVRAEVRLIRAQALLNAGDQASGAARQEKWIAADVALAGLIDDLRAGHPLLAPAFTLRALVRKRLGRSDDAQADLEEARRANSSDPAVIEQVAATYAARGQLDAALRVLYSPVVDSVPSLLAMRADMHTGLGRPADARRDLDRALAETIAPSVDNDRALVRIVRSAALLRDVSLARDAYGRISTGARDSTEGRMVAGDIAFLDGDIALGTSRYREAIDRGGTRRRALLLNLGLHLLEADQAADAQGAFEEAGVDDMSLSELEPYGVAAFRANDFAAAQAVVDRLAAAGDVPQWALAIAADIAMRREDVDGAAAYLSALERRGEASARVHLALARCLVELGEAESATQETFAAAAARPTPRERSQIAAFLKELGRARDARDEAFRAYREDRGDPWIQRVLAILTFTGGVTIPQPETVEAGTHVRLRSPSGNVREHSIFADPPVVKAAGEMTVEEAATAGILGKRVGEHVERDPGHWSRQRWTVEEILPAVVHSARTILATFADTFPDEPSPFRTISLATGDGPADWSVLIEALGERKEHATNMLRLYHELVLPLEFVATSLGTSVPELMRAAGQDPLARPLLVEWSDAHGYEGSIRAATETQSLVVTRSALATAERIGILDHLAALYQLIVPTSLLWQLRIEIAEARQWVRDGRSTMSLEGYGPHIEDIPAGDPRLVIALEAAERCLVWASTKARKEPRPFTTLGRDLSADDLQRDQLGAASYDALALARGTFGILFADDLGLRRIAVATQVQSASTPAVLQALALAGRLSREECDRLLLDLVLAGFAFIGPTTGQLGEAVRRMPGLGQAGLEQAFAPLGGPLVTATSAAALAAQAVKATALASIERVSVAAVATAAVRAMSARWSRPLAAQLVVVAAEHELRLLPPRYLESVKTACAAAALEESTSVAGANA